MRRCTRTLAKKQIFDPRRARRGLSLLTAGSLLCLSACGGGGGGGGGDLAMSPTSPSPQGIGGTGFSSSGVITGTGSIFVNGVRFDVDDAEIFVDGEPASEAELGLGMVVKVIGTREDDSNGTAERVDYDPSVEGVIDGVEFNADSSSARLDILGQVVIIERTSTVLEGVSFDDLSAGLRVELDGYLDSEGRLRATRLELEDDEDDVEVSGTISGLSGTTFFIGDLQIDASTAVIDDSLPGAALADGLLVEVEGNLVDGVLIATEVEDRDEFEDDLESNDDASAEGAISGFTGANSFFVNGLPVDASNAVISTGGLPLDDDLVVEVEGTWNGSVLIAETVVARRGRIEIEAPLADIDGSTLTLQIGSETITINTDARTLLDDDRDDIEYLGLSDLAIGDFLEIELIQDGTALIATRIDRDDDEDEIEIQAPVEAFVEGSSVTVLGITFDVASAEFENAGDDEISGGDFFANLRVGSLVSIKDDAPADGVAEEIEFEFALSLDGDREFLDDDEVRIDLSEVPEAVSTYLAENFPEADIAFVELDDDEIEVYLADGTEIKFSLLGDFLESEFEDEDEEDESDDDSSDDDSSDDDSSDDDSSDDDSSDDDSADDDSSDEPDSPDDSDDSPDTPDEPDEPDTPDESDDSPDTPDDSDSGSSTG